MKSMDKGTLTLIYKNGKLTLYLLGKRTITFISLDKANIGEIMGKKCFFQFACEGSITLN